MSLPGVNAPSRTEMMAINSKAQAAGHRAAKAVAPEAYAQAYAAEKHRLLKEAGYAVAEES